MGKDINKKPTIKQIRAVKATLENIGNPNPKTQEQVLIEAGYSKSVAQHSPTQITNSQGWNQLMDKYLTDENTAQVHNEMMNAQKVQLFVFDGEIKNKQIYRVISQITGAKLIHIRDFMTGIGNLGLRLAIDHSEKESGAVITEVNNAQSISRGGLRFTNAISSRFNNEIHTLPYSWKWL